MGQRRHGESGGCSGSLKYSTVLTCNYTRGVMHALACRAISRRRVQLTSKIASYNDGEKFVFQVIK